MGRMSNKFDSFEWWRKKDEKGDHEENAMSHVYLAFHAETRPEGSWDDNDGYGSAFQAEETYVQSPLS